MKRCISLLLTVCLLATMAAVPALAEAGTYTGVGAGKNGEGSIEVSVTLDDAGVITDVEVTKHGDDAGISDPAVEGVPAAIVAANSLAGDAVAVATLTSNGILEACLLYTSCGDAPQPRRLLRPAFQRAHGMGPGHEGGHVLPSAVFLERSVASAGGDGRPVWVGPPRLWQQGGMSMFYQVMRTELIKLRRAPVWIAFFALTALSAVMGTFN